MPIDPTVPIVFVDTETTDIGRHRRPWELAIIRREPDSTRRELQLCIEVDLSDANPYALAVGRFYDRHPLGKWLANQSSGHPANTMTLPPQTHWFPGGQPPGHASDAYVTQQDAAILWCRWTHGAHVLGAVPGFDTEVMGWLAAEHHLTAAHHYHLGDVENFIVGHLTGRLRYDPTITADERIRLTKLVNPPWDSDDMYAEIGVTTPVEDRHTALGDARTAERVWDILTLGPDPARPWSSRGSRTAQHHAPPGGGSSRRPSPGHEDT